MTLNPVQQRIYDQVVKPSIDKISGLTIARVIECDAANQVSTIQITSNDSAEQGRQVANVPMMMIGGMKQPGYMPGDTVFVVFINNSVTHPIIIGRADIEYGMRTRNEREGRFRSGSHVSDYYSSKGASGWNVE